MKRVIRLTESDLENIVRKVISEQNTPSREEERGKPQPGAKQTFNLANTFASGQYRLNDTPELQNVVKSIESFISKNPDAAVIATINAGESQVPNPQGFEEKGSLAKARAAEAEKYISSKFPNIEFSDNKITVGQTPWDVNKGKDHEDYKKEQFFTLTIDGTGKPIQPKVKIVPEPGYGTDGVIDFIGFLDGTGYTFDRNNPEQEALRRQFNLSPKHDEWRVNRSYHRQTCNQHRSLCDWVEYDKRKLIPVNSQEILNQVIQKMESEKLEWPRNVMGQEVRIGPKS